MKNTLQKIKYAVLTATLVVVGFSLNHSAEANQYVYMCADGGTITSVVNLVPPGPFTAGTPTGFQATAYMTSTCGSKVVNLTAQNNNNPVITLIATQTLNGSLPLNSTNFTSPSAAGNYAVHFITGVQGPVYIRSTPQGITQWEDTIPHGSCPATILHHYHVASTRVDFFSDPLGTVPYDVTGLGFKLVLAQGHSYPQGDTYSLSPVISGTSYTIVPGYSYDDFEGNFGNNPPVGGGFGCYNTAIPNNYGYRAIIGYPPYYPWPITPPVDYAYPIQTPSVYIDSSNQYANAGDTVVLNWGGISASSCTGTNFSTGGAPYGNQAFTVTSVPITYTVTCSNAAGTASDSVTINQYPPIINFTPNPGTITQGDSSTLTWSANYATSCTGTNFNTGGATSGSRTVSPTDTTTYTITCTGPGGIGSGSIDVTVEYPVECYDEYGGLYYCSPRSQCTGAPLYGCQ